MSRSARRFHQAGGHPASEVGRESEARYRAVVQMKWGGGWLQPGDRVPVEKGRDYGALVRAGKIALEVGDAA